MQRARRVIKRSPRKHRSKPTESAAGSKQSALTGKSGQAHTENIGHSHENIGHSQLRRLISQAQRHGVRDAGVLAAIGAVPRDKFVPESLAGSAFDDTPLPIGRGQTISQPAMVAIMAEAARISPGDRVLEVGTGSGYAAAVLRTLASRVVTVERIESLAERALTTLEACGFHDVAVTVGDGTLGWPPEAPYDAIVVAAAGPGAPMPLIEQLAPGGRLVMPVGARHDSQHLMRFTRSRYDTTASTPGTVREEHITPVRFVPLLGEHGF